MRTAADKRVEPLELPHAERTWTGVTTGFERPAAPPAIEGFDRESSAVDTLQTNSRGSMTVTRASGAVDLEPPHAERTSTGIRGTSGTTSYRRI